MNSENKPIIEQLLESEGYVAFDENKHNKFHFNLCRLVKDEIRSHKWVEAEKGRELTWEEAVIEWMNEHYENFLNEIIPVSGVRKFIEYQANKCSKVKSQ